MGDNQSSRLSIQFQSEFQNPSPENSAGDYFIPASTFGQVVASINDMMRYAWEYAIRETEDDRFIALRKLESQDILQKKDIELVIVATRPGSLIVDLDWQKILVGLAPLLGHKVVVDTLLAMIPNALWDLTKYSFGAVRNLISRNKETPEQIEDGKIDRLTSKILPAVMEIARNGYRENENVKTITTLSYREPDGTELTIAIDQYTQPLLIASNFIETTLVTRLAGSIEGVNWRKKTITVIWDMFPDVDLSCDIDGFSLKEVSQFIPSNIDQTAPKLGFDVELAWRRGVPHVFPPDSIRILGIVPTSELLNPKQVRYSGLSRPGIIEQGEILTPDEIKFLKWFAWADAKWDYPQINSVTKYVLRDARVFNRNISLQEVSGLIRGLIKRGIILQARSFTKNGYDVQLLRLNRNHPQIVVNHIHTIS